MGKCKGCGKLGRMLTGDGPAKAYHYALLCSPVVSVWDCIVRKMRYSYIPEWVFMDNKACNKVRPGVRKAKKKQVKDELDRIKQAEKKKRRLEKALATSAAMRSELEKKKQQKKEEQQRLDDEGAAIAEAVALHVLLGEDTDDVGNFNLFINGGSGPCLPHQVHSKGLVTNASYRAGCEWAMFGNSDWSFSCGDYGRDMIEPCFEDSVWGTAGLSAGLIAAQAVSALRITENAEVNTVVLNGMLRGYD
ncbi:hypothetical protein Gotri_017495 [Gossypium trilobum]|uniref:Uncharacterized protein n=1 Tax=Gossypium trilobum TaxID=34281 RepID=A0A7J9E6Q2_9ROSI|nr:hypothetical protein [Gossypium trilobum]